MQQMSNEVTALREIVSNETLPVAQRRDAAAHAVELMVDAVPQPGDDDAEVVELMTPWTENDAILGDFYVRAWGMWNERQGWAASGPTQGQARKHVHKLHRLRRLLAIVADESADRLERLAACERISEDHMPKGGPRNIRKTSEQLLTSIKPANALKWVAGEFGASVQVPVARPPQSFADMW